MPVSLIYISCVTYLYITIIIIMIACVTYLCKMIIAVVIIGYILMLSHGYISRDVESTALHKTLQRVWNAKDSLHLKSTPFKICILIMNLDTHPTRQYKEFWGESLYITTKEISLYIISLYISLYHDIEISLLS